jgi:hypothetical protein
MCLTWKKWFIQKEFPKWVPYACCHRTGPSAEARQGPGREPPSPPTRTHTASVLTLRQLRLFRQKTSRQTIDREFQRLFQPGEIAPGASSVPGEPQGPTEVSEALT